MTLFHYPKAIHVRVKNPPPSNDYRKYKPFLREEFDGTCVYCRKPDRLGDLDAFGVDHYRPRKHFTFLVTEYSNLFYACNTCNRRKGEFWPSRMQLRNEQFVPNPCAHVMFQHLRSGATGDVDPHSNAGKWTIDLLILNEPARVEFRKAMLYAVSLALEMEGRLRKTIEALEEGAKAATGATKAELLSKKQNHERELENVVATRRTLTGS